MAKKPPILTFLRHNVATSLRHDVKFHMLQCAYTMPMCVPNLKQIGRKTRPQWPKNHLNGRFYVKTSRRSYVMTLFFTCYDAPILCPCVYQIWSKSIEKHGHSGPKTPKMDVFTSLRSDVITSWRLFSYGTKRLCHAHFCTKFEANRLKNTATVAKKPPKWTFLRHNVATSLRHDVFFHMLQCAYTMSMFPPNLKQIGWKTRPQWPKNLHKRPKMDVFTS